MPTLKFSKVGKLSTLFIWGNVVHFLFEAQNVFTTSVLLQPYPSRSKKFRNCLTCRSLPEVLDPERRLFTLHKLQMNLSLVAIAIQTSMRKSAFPYIFSTKAFESSFTCFIISPIFLMESFGSCVIVPDLLRSAEFF